MDDGTGGARPVEFAGDEGGIEALGRSAEDQTVRAGQDGGGYGLGRVRHAR
jgi:hypothetical protein